MNAGRILTLLRKEFFQGLRGWVFYMAVIAPLLISLLLSLVFGSLLSRAPRLGIVDEGGSALVAAAQARDAFETRLYADTAALERATEDGAVDMGVVLPPALDAGLASGETQSVRAYLWGESLARHRLILGVALADLFGDLAGRESPVEIETITLGESTAVPLTERLLPLIVLITIVIAGIFLPATSLVEERQKGTLSALTVTPVTLRDVYISKGLLGAIVSFTMGLVILVLNGAVVAHPALLVGVLALDAVAAAMFGILLGSLTRDVTSLFATLKMIGIFLYAPGIVRLFPQIPEWIGRIFPTYWMIQPVVELSLEGAGASEIAPDVAGLLLLILILAGGVYYASGHLQQQEALA